MQGLRFANMYYTNDKFLRAAANLPWGRGPQLRKEAGGSPGQETPPVERTERLVGRRNGRRWRTARHCLAGRPASFASTAARPGHAL